MSSIILCADSESVRHPELLGLAGESLASQTWLEVFSEAEEARRKVRQSAQDVEVWVSGSDDVDAINLAAAIKGDGDATVVRLLAFQGSGSLYSRAQAAGIDEVLDKTAFLKRYHESKRRDVLADALPSPLGSSCLPQPSLSDQPERKEQKPRPRFNPTVHASAPRTNQRGFLLTIVGAGGGTGKSSLAVLAACLAQQSGLSTVLVDADLQFGDLRYLAGMDNAIRLDQLVEAPARIDSLAAHDATPALVAAPDRIEQSELVSGQVPHLVERLRERFECVVVSTGASWDESHVKLIEEANTALFVIDQRPSSVRACRRALALCTRCGIATQDFAFVLNRCSRQALFSSIDVSCALQGVHVSEISDGGREVEELLGAGLPHDLLASKNAYANSVRTLMQTMLPAPTAHAPSIPSIPATRIRKRLVLRRKKAACL